MALQATSNIYELDILSVLAPSVIKLFQSPQADIALKKKIYLCLLHLHRQNSELISISELRRTILEAADDSNLAVRQCLFGFIMEIGPANFPEMIRIILNDLKFLTFDVDSKINSYHGVSGPWARIELFRFLRHYNQDILYPYQNEIEDILVEILKVRELVFKSIQKTNATNAVLLECVNLTFHMESKRAMNSALDCLKGFLYSENSNLRLVALETILRQQVMSLSLKHFLQSAQDILFSCMHQRDPLLRNYAMDILFRICDQSNASSIISEFLKILSRENQSIRQKMSLQLIFVAEKYALSDEWYFDTCLSILNLTGDSSSKEFWYRLVRKVINTYDMRMHACKKIMSALKRSSLNETIIKIAAYILGEYGDLIAENEGCSPSDQFLILRDKFSFCEPDTKCMILTTFVKFVNLFPELKTETMRFFKNHVHSIDAEIQQRAVEYLRLCELNDEDLLQLIFDEMPPFLEKS